MKDDHELEAALRAMAEPRAEDAPAVERIMLRLETSRLPPQQRAMRWWPSVLMD